ncbi:MAG: CHAT domain-containing tetratricopeptide repeat protein [Saprospiraceae bacterium]
MKQVDSLIQVSRGLTSKRNYDQALEVNATAEKIALEKLGRNSATYGNCCFNHGRVSFFKTDYLQAEKWYLESKLIREKALGREHPDYASSLNNLAGLYMNVGQYEKAEQLYLETKSIREKVMGREHPDYASSLNNLALLYMKLGQYEKAEILYLETKSIREKVLGKKHPEYAKCLNNLAILYKDLGQYEKAEPLYLEFNAIWEKVMGREHPDYAKGLNNLAVLYKDMGQYEKAELLYLESNAIREKALGKEHPDYATSLSNLAILYMDLGQYGKAEPLYLESKSIREKALGKEHPDYATSLNNLAILYMDLGQYEKAELYCLESKSIREKTFGKEHPEYATSLNNLAILYMNLSQYEKALPFYIESKAIWEKLLGKEHPDYAFCLNSLANLYIELGHYEKAESLLLESKAIREKVLGKEHPYYAWNLYNLAYLYHLMGQYKKAEPLFLELITASKLLIERAMQYLSEKELNLYLNKFLQFQSQTLSFTQNYQSEVITSVCYENTLFYKGFLLQAVNKIRRMALSDSNVAEKYNLLKSFERRLASEYTKPIVERKGVKELEEKANTLEKEIARTVAGIGEAMRQITWKEVQTSLKEGEAALEFVHFRKSASNREDSILYSALLVMPGTEHPLFVGMFEEKSLDSLLLSRNGRKADYVNGLYTLDDRGAIAMEAPKRTLYEILWKPLEKVLDGVKTIYYSPCGLLHRINLDAIPISETETIADRYKLIELNSTRQLVIPTNIKTAHNDAVVYGAIQYDAQRNDIQSEPMIASRARGEFEFQSLDSTAKTGSWKFLPWTESEVSNIEKIMQVAGVLVQLNKSGNASELSFKNLGTNSSPSPRILHIATHGYFFPDPKQLPDKIQTNERESVFKSSDHPMLRSGLIFSGGNSAWQGKLTPEGMEDGVLTAYEISQLNLSNTELVVLSACETGLGDIQGNEGVYGLQRAFKIAGVKYIIMSLWQVPDKQTSMLMTTFYKKWLEDKLSIPDAFHAAQKALREQGFDPHQWAGFVLIE